MTDFGIAKAVSVAGGANLTQTGIAIGTPAYMSPEQAAGETDLDGRSDQYSLACVLYEMLTGEPHSRRQRRRRLIAKRFTETPRPVTRNRSGDSGIRLGRAFAKRVARRERSLRDRRRSHPLRSSRSRRK